MMMFMEEWMKAKKLAFKISYLLTHFLFFLMIVSIIIATARYRGLFSTFTDVADADSIYVGQSLLFNAHMTQTYFDHTGYLYTLLLSKFFLILHALKIIPVDNMKQLYVYPNFGNAFSMLIYHGRIFSILMSIIFVSCFYFGLIKIKVDRAISFLLSIILASSSGIAIQTLVLRPELISALCGMIAFFFFVSAFQEYKYSFLLKLFFGAFFNLLAMSAKIQAIIHFLIIPFLAIAFVNADQLITKWSLPEIVEKEYRRLRLFFMIISVPFLLEFLVNLFIHGFHLYKLLAPLCYCIFILIIRYFFGFSKQWLKTIGFYLLGGFSIALYINLFHFNQKNIGAIFVWLHQLTAYAATSVKRDLIPSFFIVFYHVITIKFQWPIFLKHPINGFFFIFLGVIIYALFRKKYWRALSVGVFLFICLVIEAAFCLRYFSAYYYIYTEYLYLLGFSLLYVKKNTVVLQKIFFTLIALCIIAISLASNFKTIQQNSFHAVNIKQSPSNFCDQTHYTPPLQTLMNRGHSCDSFILQSIQNINN